MLFVLNQYLSNLKRKTLCFRPIIGNFENEFLNFLNCRNKAVTDYTKE